MDSSVSLLSNSTSPPIPYLPYCKPESPFLLFVSQQFRACIPTFPAFVSTMLGFCSIGSWLFAQLPQIVTNYRLKSTEGLSFLFLLNWCFGDSLNFTGAVLLDQMTFQKVIAAYYVMVDIVLVGQWIWYSKPAAALDTYNSVDSGETIVVSRAEAASVTSVKKGRNKLLLTLSLLFTSSNAIPLAAVIVSGPVARIIAASSSTPAATASGLDGESAIRLGRFVAWMSTALYLSSRAPQLYLNYRRRSVDGLSPLLFASAFCGNFFYTTSLLSNPSAWKDIGPFGEGGWVGERGTDMAEWWKDTLPFMLGAAGVLGMDGCVGLQFWMWSKNATTPEVTVGVEIPEDGLDGSGYDVEVRGRKHDGDKEGGRAWSRFAGINIKRKDEKDWLLYGSGSSAATPTNGATEGTSLLIPRLDFGRNGSYGVRGLGEIDGDTVYGSTSSAGAMLEAEFGKGCKGKGVGSP